jgi:hypothetical protein
MHQACLTNLKAQISVYSASLTDAIYDCSSLYQKNYRISGVYKLPPDEFLGSPELEVRSLLPCPTLCPPALKGTWITGLLLVYGKGSSRIKCTP